MDTTKKIERIPNPAGFSASASSAKPIAALFVLALLSSAVLSGCGQQVLANGKSGDSSRDYNSGYLPQANGSSYSDGNYVCPAQPNILPTSDQTLDGTERYTSCINEGSSQFLLKGSSSRAAQICVFPVLYTSQTSYSAVRDAYGYPLYACFPDANARFELSFPGKTYNGLEIVNIDSWSGMLACLQNANIACPQHSYGQILKP